VGDGSTSGPAYTTALQRGDTVLKLTEIVQSNLNKKPVKPQMPGPIAIDGHLLKEDEQEAAYTKSIRDQQWQTVLASVPDDNVDSYPILHQQTSANGRISDNSAE
jgi:hypothetical protein